MKRWELRRHIQETRPFELLTFTMILLEKLCDKGILTDDELMQMLKDQQNMSDPVRYE